MSVGPSKTQWHHQREHFYEEDNIKISRVWLWREGFRMSLSNREVWSTGLFDNQTVIHISFSGVIFTKLFVRAQVLGDRQRVPSVLSFTTLMEMV